MTGESYGAQGIGLGSVYCVIHRDVGSPSLALLNVIECSGPLLYVYDDRKLTSMVFSRLESLCMVEKAFIFVVVAGLLLIVIRGLWRATSVQEGTGCPVCDKHAGCSQADHDHDSDDQDQEAAHGSPS